MKGEKMNNEIHPAPLEFNEDEILQDKILRYFHYKHLPPSLQSTSREFCRVARFIIDTCPRTPERTVALRKLLESKDCAVRAHIE